MRLMEKCPVKTHFQPEPDLMKKNINYVKSKENGKLGADKSGFRYGEQKLSNRNR